MDMTHSNYPHQAYQNSQVDSMNIIGEFPVQNSDDAKHWVATVNFLRTATKMFFGKDDGNGLKGNPPPILHLFGYGDHMFHKIPVVLNSFNVELRAGIDYISTKQGSVYNKTTARSPNEPEASDSRESIKNFSMKKFVRGELNGKDSNEVGFI